MCRQLGAYSPCWVEQHGSHMASTTVRNDSGFGFTLNYKLKLRRTKKHCLVNLGDFFAVTYHMNIQRSDLTPLRSSLIGPEEAMGSIPGGTEYSLVVYSSSRMGLQQSQLDTCSNSGKCRQEISGCSKFRMGSKT